jgi:hypothetical protein
MRVLTNTIGSYLTGTAIADSVMGYGLVLARHRQVDLVEIPILDGDGLISRVQLRVGWLADMTCRDHHGTRRELLDAESVRQIDSKSQALRDPIGRPFTAEDLVDIEWEDDHMLIDPHPVSSAAGG